MAHPHHTPLLSAVGFPVSTNDDALSERYPGSVGYLTQTESPGSLSVLVHVRPVRDWISVSVSGSQWTKTNNPRQTESEADYDAEGCG